MKDMMGEVNINVYGSSRGVQHKLTMAIVTRAILISQLVAS